MKKTWRRIIVLLVAALQRLDSPATAALLLVMALGAALLIARLTRRYASAEKQ